MNDGLLCAIIKDNGDIQFQDACYIDEGCYIILRNNIFELWEFSNGDEDLHIGDFENIRDAMKKSIELT